MINFQQTRWETIIIAPIIFILILTGLWLVGAAAYENYRISSASDQIIRVVSLARDMRIPKYSSIDNVTKSFFSRMGRLNIAPIIITKPAFLENSPQRGYENSWGNPASIYFSPKEQYIRIEGMVSASACRRLLLLYRKEAGELGIRRVDVKNEEITSLWRLVYHADKKEKNKKISSPAIYSGCGDDGNVLLSISFYL